MCIRDRYKSVFYCKWSRLFSRWSIVAFIQFHNQYMYSPSCPALIVTFLSRNVLIGNRCRSICPIYYARDFLVCSYEHSIGYCTSTFHYFYVCLHQHKGKHSLKVKPMYIALSLLCLCKICIIQYMINFLGSQHDLSEYS